MATCAPVTARGAQRRPLLSSPPHAISFPLLASPPQLPCSSSSSRRQHRCTSLLPSSSLQPFTVAASVLSSPSPLPTANAAAVCLPPLRPSTSTSAFVAKHRQHHPPPRRLSSSFAVPVLRTAVSLFPFLPLLSPSLLLRPFGHRSHPSMGSSAVTRIRRLSLFSFFRSSNAPDLAADLPFFLNLLLPPLPAVAAVIFPRCRRALSSPTTTADHPTERHHRRRRPPLPTAVRTFPPAPCVRPGGRWAGEGTGRWAKQEMGHGFGMWVSCGMA